MSSCCRSTCSRSRTNSPCIEWDDSDDDGCGDDPNRKRLCSKKARSRKSSCGSDDMLDVIVVERTHRHSCQSPSVYEPRPSCSRCHWSCTWQQKIKRTIEELYCFWKKICKDPFKWEILKSGLWFTLGLRLFKEMRSESDELKRKPKFLKKIKRTC